MANGKCAHPETAAIDEVIAALDELDITEVQKRAIRYATEQFDLVDALVSRVGR